ncbi:MAG: hypothetical protein ABJA70_01080 [Chryseolinea sp.]
MRTSVTGMAFLRHKGVQCYGIGPISDTKDAPKKGSGCKAIRRECRKKH